MHLLKNFLKNKIMKNLAVFKKIKLIHLIILTKIVAKITFIKKIISNL